MASGRRFAHSTCFVCVPPVEWSMFDIFEKLLGEMVVPSGQQRSTSARPLTFMPCLDPSTVAHKWLRFVRATVVDSFACVHVCVCCVGG